MNRRHLGERRTRAQEQERQAAHQVAAFIADARRRGLGNDAILMAIDRAWPRLSARVLIAGHFLDQLKSEPQQQRGH